MTATPKSEARIDDRIEEGFLKASGSESMSRSWSQCSPRNTAGDARYDHVIISSICTTLVCGTGGGMEASASSSQCFLNMTTMTTPRSGGEWLGRKNLPDLPSESLLRICEYVAGSSSQGNIGLLSLLTVCRATYSHPAITAFWRTLPGLYPLVYTLPSSLCQITQRDSEELLSFVSPLE